MRRLLLDNRALFRLLLEVIGQTWMFLETATRLFQMRMLVQDFRVDFHQSIDRSVNDQISNGYV